MIRRFRRAGPHEGATGGARERKLFDERDREGSPGVVVMVLARFLRSLLFRVDSGDPRVYAAVAAALAGSALAAALIATLSAARLDPVRTLREEGTSRP